MRFIYTLLCTLCFTWLVGGQSIRPPAGAQAKGSTPPPDLTVAGRFQGSYDDAYRSALEAAPDELVAYLRQQGVALEWRPTPQYVSKLIDARPEIIAGPDVEVEPGVKGPTYKVALHLKVPVGEMIKLDREYRMQLRMFQAGKVLAALVAVLAAVAGYFRLDELSKGYYTAWLRLATIGVAGGAVGLLLLFA